METTVDTPLRLIFHGDTQELVKKKTDRHGGVDYPLTRRASIKDIIEALGVPHTEVGRLRSDDRELDFSFIPAGGDTVRIDPLSPQLPVTRATALRPEPLDELRFMADATVGKLARLMRMTGIDTGSAAAGPPRTITAEARRQQRVLLTRNRELLKDRHLVFGRLLRSEDPREQFGDIKTLFNLAPVLRPFSRCMACNEPLEPVAKERILDRLEPLTRKYFHTFKHCPGCGRIYWRGSHHERMTAGFGALMRPPARHRPAG